jgi:hypothetical protein
MASNAVMRMAAGAAACLIVVLLVAGRDAQGAVLLGVPGPLAAAVGSWTILARARARTPERVSAVMVKLFAAKLVFFAAYVVLAVRLLDGGLKAFVVSFTCQYVVLHAIEAMSLRRLFAAGDGVGVKS